MLVFAIVALRLIGLWLFATQVGQALVHVFGWMGLVEISPDPLVSALMFSVAVLPTVGGVVLIALARPIARLMVPAEASESPGPEPLTAKTYTQIGVFLIGVWMLAYTAPYFGRVALNGWEMSLDFWIRLGVGLALVLGSGALAGLIKHLRKWP
jgi:hypothetical protein